MINGMTEEIAAMVLHLEDLRDPKGYTLSQVHVCVHMCV